MNRLATTSLVALVAFGLGMATDRFLIDRPGVPQGESRTIFNETDEGTTALSDVLASRQARADHEGHEEERPFSGSAASLLQVASNPDRRQAMQQLERLLHRADTPTLERLLGETAQLDSSDPNYRLLQRALFQRWAHLDPATALTKALETDHRDLQRDVIHIAFRELAERDLAQAQSWLTKLPSPDWKREALFAIVDAARLEDLPLVADFVSELPNAREYRDFYRSWADRDPEAAALHAMASPENPAVASVAEAWAGHHPEEALAWAQSLTNPRQRSRAYAHALSSIAATQPARAAELLSEVPHQDHQRELVRHVAHQWSRQDMTGALEWIDTLTGALQTEAMDEVLHDWAHNDPESAAAYVSDLPASERKLDFTHRVARAWSESDQSAALDWAMSQENPSAWAHALDGLANVWAEQDPASAGEFALSLEAGEARQELLHTVGNRWSQHNVAEALDWAQQLAGRDHQHVTRGIVEQVAESDPFGAADLYSQLLGNLEQNALTEAGYDHLAGDLAGHWSEYSPHQAADWAEGLPEVGDIRRRAIESVADRWVQADSLAASEWIGQLPQGGARDAATERLVDHVSESDPNAAYEWALTLSSTEHQTDVLHHVFSQWREQDASAAQAAFNNARVTAEQREAIGDVFTEN